MKVLLIDDCADSAFLLAELLKKCGYEARWTPDGTKGLRIASEWKPDAVFVDIAMPGENGYAVAMRLRSEAHLENALIVALSSYVDDKARRASAGIDAHLLKPASLQDVRSVLEPRYQPIGGISVQ
jgi:CheY-like chemotaxis protein